MSLDTIEKRRKGLIIFLISLIMSCLVLIMVVAWQIPQANLIKGLGIIALLACLYVLGQERKLRAQSNKLIGEFIGKNKQVASFGKTMKEEGEERADLASRLSDLTSLYRAIGAVNSVADPERVPGVLLSAGLELVGGDCGSLMMVDGDVLTFAGAIGLDQRWQDDFTQKVGEGVAGYVAEHGEPLLLIGNIKDDDDLFVERKPHKKQLSTSMCIPLQLGKRVIGVINLGASMDSGREPFGDDEMRFAFIFAQHASVAFELAHLLESDDQQAEISGLR